MQAIECQAVLLNEAGQAATVEQVVVHPPGPNEVRIKVMASGVCHTDLTVKNLNGMGMNFPIVLGHEGAGYVESVGEGVTHLQAGDPVVIAYRAPCEQCPACRRGDPRHCYVALRPKPRIHRKRDDAVCAQVLRCGTFSEYTVVHSKAAIKMPAAMPLDKACLIACGVITGVGATFNTAPVFPGARGGGHRLRRRGIKRDTGRETRPCEADYRHRHQPDQIAMGQRFRRDGHHQCS